PACLSSVWGVWKKRGGLGGPSPPPARRAKSCSLAVRPVPGTPDPCPVRLRNRGGNARGRSLRDQVSARSGRLRRVGANKSAKVMQERANEFGQRTALLGALWFVLWGIFYRIRRASASIFCPSPQATIFSTVSVKNQGARAAPEAQARPLGG